ncbi:MAG: wax ester/triacylglycerol synthase family O-acyltransferase [Acidimicrobiales bacterium]
MISTTPGLSAPRVSFNDVIGEHRRFAYASMPLHSVKAVKTAADATVNDVIMALVGSVLRQWLRDHDELRPSPSPPWCRSPCETPPTARRSATSCHRAW